VRGCSTARATSVWDFSRERTVVLLNHCTVFGWHLRTRPKGRTVAKIGAAELAPDVELEILEPGENSGLKIVRFPRIGGGLQALELSDHLVERRDIEPLSGQFLPQFLGSLGPRRDFALELPGIPDTAWIYVASWEPTTDGRTVRLRRPILPTALAGLWLALTLSGLLSLPLRNSLPRLLALSGL
jgi:hypothetical protein